MNDMNKNSRDYRDPSSNKVKNPRVWVYVLLGVLLFAGIATWMTLSPNNVNNTPSNSISSGSNNGSINQPEQNSNSSQNYDGSVSSDSESVQK